MYKCQNCNKTSLPRETINRIVTKTRKKVYEFEVQKGRNIITKTNEGWEIVEELEVCKECYNRLHDKVKSTITNKDKTILKNTIQNLPNLEV